ncbi:MAG: AGE family epimerase/isomerase [Rhizobiales bacterium]|nr:AGE family epimerase/isomerase [Hyphomicrobiales bacterium]
MIQSPVEKLRTWVRTEALPFWGTVGFDVARGSFVERADFAGAPLLDVPRRAMVQARQIYVFAHAALLDWWPQGRDIALTGAQNLIARYFEPDGRPGWAFSVAADGAVYDARRDLYTHAFALFGLAWAYRLEPRPAFRDIALATLAVLDKHFASPSGGFHVEHPAELGSMRQNPHMHLFEAMIAWHEASGEGPFLARAGKLRDLMAERFIQPATGILAEYFDGAWQPEPGARGRICEPGHHYEWCWLLRRYARLSGQNQDELIATLYSYAGRHGFDRSGLIVDELLDDGSVHKASRRCWPHTEAIKADAGAFEAGDTHAAERAARLIERTMATFLGRPVSGGWIDHIDAGGKPMTSFMPASTLYHIMLATAEVDRVWGVVGGGPR